MELYKGYIKTSGKVAGEKFKNRTDFKSLEEVEKFNSYAGILSDNIVLIDIDNYDDSEILFNIVKKLNIKTKVFKTTKGKHFLFKNNKIKKNKTNCGVAIGISSDIKIGEHNSYQVLKYKGALREILLEYDEIDEIPVWLIPIDKKENFSDLEEGDGRNQVLFNHILTLQRAGMSVDQIKQTLVIINDFVLEEKISEKELEVIMREESFTAPNFYGGPNGTTFMHANFAKYLIANDHVVKINNQLHIYRDGYYLNGNHYIENKMIKLVEHLTKQKRNEVLHWLNAYIDENTQISNANFIGFKNGIYDIFSDELYGFSYEKIITNKIDWEYDPNAYSELVDNTLNKLACQDKEIRMLLEEVIGYCLFTRNELGKAFVLIGDRANGKSTFLDMIKTMLGDNNISSLDLNELGDRFKTAELFNKLANIGDDIGDEFIANPSIFKKLVTGDRLSAERKGQDPFEFNNYSKMLFSANNIPRIKDKTGAVLRRLVIIPFNATFSVKDADYRPYIKYELREKECIKYLIQLGIKGLKRILQNQKFTESKLAAKELIEYEINNNPILGFFNDLRLSDIENESTNDVYKKYNEYCIINNFNPMSKIEFSKQIKKHYNLEITDKKINGKKYRIFKKRS